MITRRCLLQAAALAPAALTLRSQQPAAQGELYQRYLRGIAATPRGPEWDSQLLTTGPQYVLYLELAKLATGQPIDPKAFDSALSYIKDRRDCMEFGLSAVLRILYLYGEDPRIQSSLRERLERTVLDFRYWLYPDDPYAQIKNCNHTENHDVLFSSAELLAGQFYPDRTFTWKNKPGVWHQEHGRRFLTSWLSVRAKYGFSEWIAPGYYNEDFIGLFNVIDFAKDPEIAKAARAVAELAFLDLALHCFDMGARASSGRSYLEQLNDSRYATTGPVIALSLGVPPPASFLSSAAVCYATSPSYRFPEVLNAIARPQPGEILVRQRSGISPEEAFAEGFKPEDPYDIHVFWSQQAYTHPKVFLATLEACRRWGCNIPTRDWAGKLKELEAAGGDASKLTDTSNTALYGANVESFRTPDYMVSTAQDYRKGKMGMQQQIWLASLGGAASVWTSHPGSDDEDWMGRPNYWVGNGVLPRAAQYRNLVLALYRIPQDDPRPLTHLRLPMAEFDEVREQAGWIFARKGNGYIGVTSRPFMTPAERPEYAKIEKICRALECGWICRMGRRAHDGSFDQFVGRLLGASVAYGANRLRYRESSRLTATFGWDEDLVINGRRIALGGYPRYESPFVKAKHGQTLFRIEREGKRHQIDVSGIPVRPTRDVPPLRPL